MDGHGIQARNCPNCGASLEVAPVAGKIHCRYCGHSFDLPREPPPPHAAPPPQRPVIVVNAPTVERVIGQVQSAVSTVITSAVVLGVVVAIGGGILASHKGCATVSMPDLKLPLVANLPNLVPNDFMWDTVGGPPIPATVGGAGVEGLVGRIRMRPGDDLWVAAFDGTRFQKVWAAGPFGKYSQGYQSTLFRVVGHDVVVTDYRATVHVYDLATGHEARSLKLSDRAKEMCASPDGKNVVWIALTDESSVSFDAEAGTATPTPRPAWCPDRTPSDDCRGWLKRGPPMLSCHGPDVAPKVTGFQASNVVEEGDVAVALGKKHPGTAIPMAVGFDLHAPKTMASVKWEQPIPAGDQTNAAESSTVALMDALVDGRFVAPYQLTPKGWHLTAFDARSGERIWDVPLQPIIGVDHPEGFALSATRVYVMRTVSIEVYDAKTGALAGTVGLF